MVAIKDNSQIGWIRITSEDDTKLEGQQIIVTYKKNHENDTILVKTKIDMTPKIWFKSLCNFSVMQEESAERMFLNRVS